MMYFDKDLKIRDRIDFSIYVGFESNKEYREWIKDNYKMICDYIDQYYHFQDTINNINSLKEEQRDLLDKNLFIKKVYRENEPYVSELEKEVNKLISLKESIIQYINTLHNDHEKKEGGES